jgi:hypothetical protein
MKQDHAVWTNRQFLTTVAFTFVLGLAGTPVFAEEEIHWDSNESTQTSKPVVTPVESPMAASPTVAASPLANTPTQAKPIAGMAAPTATPTGETDSDLQESEVSTPIPAAVAPTATMAIASAKASPVATVLAATPQPTSSIITVQGVLKMKDVYALGMKCYNQNNFVDAIKYLKQALTVHDPYTPSFYYAEANAMLGVIYQFHIIHPDLAYQYYHEALKIDPTTETAKNHIDQVKPDQN